MPLPHVQAAGEIGLTPVALEGDTPIQRHLSLLELIATREAPSTLQGLTDETGLPKATLHRMLQQLEEARMIRRDIDGRNFYTGTRLRRMAERTLLTDTTHGARHRVLKELVDTLGESCNLTALAGDEVLYIDRVETTEPLRVTLSVGSRVPAHASASGKLLLAGLRPARRRKLINAADLTAFTPNTITDPAALEEAIALSADRGWAVDDEEYLAGLVCAAVPVPAVEGIPTLAVAVQAPSLRLDVQRVPDIIPALRDAAQAIAEIEIEEDGL